MQATEKSEATEDLDGLSKQEMMGSGLDLSDKPAEEAAQEEPTAKKAVNEAQVVVSAQLTFEEFSTHFPLFLVIL